MSEQMNSKRISYTAGGYPEYIGDCLPGDGVETNPVWRIQRLVYAGANTIEIGWAGGTLDYDKIWTARAGYTYT